MPGNPSASSNTVYSVEGGQELQIPLRGNSREVLEAVRVAFPAALDSLLNPTCGAILNVALRGLSPTQLETLQIQGPQLCDCTRRMR